MKKIIGITVVTLGLLGAVITEKAQADYFEGGAQFGKTKTHKTTTQRGPVTHTHITSKSKGGYVKGSVSGVSKQDLKRFYKGELKPMLQGQSSMGLGYFDFEPVQQKPERVQHHRHHQSSTYYSQPAMPKMPPMPKMPEMPKMPRMSGFGF